MAKEDQPKKVPKAKNVKKMPKVKPLSQRNQNAIAKRWWKWGQ